MYNTGSWTSALSQGEHDEYLTVDLITRIQKKIAEMQEKPLSDKDAKRIALLERQVQFGLAMVERMRV